jgi:hypothetical protein
MSKNLAATTDAAPPVIGLVANERSEVGQLTQTAKPARMAPASGTRI